jgi:pilus assembly protein CpaE
MSIEILLASGSERTRQRMAHMLAEAEGLNLAHIAGDGAAIADTLERNAKIDVLILDETLEDGQGHAVARAVGASNPLVGIVMLVESAGPEQFRTAMDSGARSVISESSSLDEIVSRIEAVARWVVAARNAVTAELNGGRGGRVIAVAGAKGGVGTSTVALLLARGLIATHTVSLIDFDLQSGDLAAYAGVHTRRSLVDLVDIAGEMSGRVLRETSYDIDGGLRLLPAPNEGERAEEMTGDAARAIVNALRYQFDVSVIDVGSRLDDATALVLEYADAALLVATPDLPALRSARKTLAMWERLAVRPPSSVDLVLNRHSNRSEVQESLARRIVEVPVALVIPDGGAGFESAMNTATILAVSTRAHAAAAHFGAVLDKRLAAPTVDSGPVRVGAPVTAAPVNGHRAAPAESRRSHRGDDRGQSTVELPIVFGMALLIFLICAQGIAWGAGFILARNAAQEGARTMGIARAYDSTSIDNARRDALGELSGPWADRANVDVGPDSVRVTIVAPTIVPGLELTSDATVAVFKEP